jgi:hypothetical protein
MNKFMGLSQNRMCGSYGFAGTGGGSSRYEDGCIALQYIGDIPINQFLGNK